MEVRSFVLNAGELVIMSFIKWNKMPNTNKYASIRINTNKFASLGINTNKYATLGINTIKYASLGINTNKHASRESVQ
jgi:hypothetical protein